MLKNSMYFAGSAMVLVLLSPMMMGTLQNATRPPGPSPSEQVEPVRPQNLAATERYREKIIPADRGGQYSVDALVNGVNGHFLVDTGATMVTISADLAARIGVTPEPGKPKWTMHTANGDSFASPVILKNVNLGSVFLTNVEALIVDRGAGEVNLLGESFLRRLSSVEQRGGSLILRQ